MKLRTHVIHGRSEECDCAYCGCPLYSGDRAKWDSDAEEFFCGSACAKKWTQPEERDRTDPPTAIDAETGERFRTDEGTQ